MKLLFTFRALFAFVVIILISYLSFLIFAQPVFAQEFNCGVREECERQLAELEAQIQKQEATITEYQKQGKTLQGEIGNLNAQINKANLKIKAINVTLSKLDKEILETKGSIATTESKIRLNQEALRRAIRTVYESERLGFLGALLQSRSLSDFATDLDNLAVLQKTLTSTVNTALKLRGELVGQKDKLEEQKSEAVSLKSFHDAQKKTADSIKQTKNTLLTQTKGQETKYQTLLKETRKTAAQIRSRFFEFLGGGELTFEEAYKFSQFAEQATGIRAAMILAVLDRESALGQNVGKCTYQKAMHPTRDVPTFLALTAALGINPETITVSCANRDGAYGGAMGPAQFIPSTWKLYSSKVAEITGSNPASPWRNGDAFVATALYLKDAIKGCDAVYSKQLDKERCAAAKYYAGSRWRSHLWGYGDRVVTKAQQVQQDIDILND